MPLTLVNERANFVNSGSQRVQTFPIKNIFALWPGSLVRSFSSNEFGSLFGDDRAKFIFGDTSPLQPVEQPTGARTDGASDNRANESDNYPRRGAEKNGRLEWLHRRRKDFGVSSWVYVEFEGNIPNTPTILATASPTTQSQFPDVRGQPPARREISAR